MRVSFFLFSGGVFFCFFWEFRLGYFSLSNLLALFGREEEEIRGQANMSIRKVVIYERKKMKKQKKKKRYK